MPSSRPLNPETSIKTTNRIQCPSSPLLPGDSPLPWRGSFGGTRTCSRSAPRLAEGRSRLTTPLYSWRTSYPLPMLTCLFSFWRNELISSYYYSPEKKNHFGLAYWSQWLSYLISRNQLRFALNENTCKQQHLRHKSVVFHFYWKSSPSNTMKENSFDFYNRIKNQLSKPQCESFLIYFWKREMYSIYYEIY